MAQPPKSEHDASDVISEETSPSSSPDTLTLYNSLSMNTIIFSLGCTGASSAPQDRCNPQAGGRRVGRPRRRCSRSHRIASLSLNFISSDDKISSLTLNQYDAEEARYRDLLQALAESKERLRHEIQEMKV